MRRVTDLDKFALEEVWRPYQNRSGLSHGERFESIPVTLEETAQLLSVDSEWSQCVLRRIAAIGFSFPPYVVHPLVDVITQTSQVGRTESRTCSDTNLQVIHRHKLQGTHYVAPTADLKVYFDGECVVRTNTGPSRWVFNEIAIIETTFEGRRALGVLMIDADHHHE